MKKLLPGPGLLLVLAAAPAQAQESCYENIACQYLKDPGLSLSGSDSPWTWGDPTWRQVVTDTCSTTPGVMTAAANLPRAGTLSQRVTTSRIFPRWTVGLNIYFGDAGGGTADLIAVDVLNVSTNVTETHSTHAGLYGTCGRVNIILNNNYSNTTVKVTVRRGISGWSTMPIAVDNIRFWGEP